MNIQTLFKNAPITTALLVSFVVLFTVQVATGVDINNPDSQTLIDWGANVLPYTLGFEPWRLITSAFLHIGFMHLLFNAFAMYFFGQAAEITFGSIKFLLLFLLSAIGGNLLNSYYTWWKVLHAEGAPSISAGASGGIMGIGMSLLIVELLKHTVLKLPKTGDDSQLKSLALVMGINLMYGFAVPGIDNAGHIGGAMTGAVLTIFIVFSYRYTNTLNTILFNISPLKRLLLNALPWAAFIPIGVTFYWLWLDLHLQLGL